jgi:quercetin dioxygenase-like cupin family protein
MRIYDTGPNTGKRLQEPGTHGARVATLVNERDWHVALLELEPNGALGAHRTETDQLLVVVQGSARVSSEGDRPVDAAPGSAIFWNRGEQRAIRAGAEGLVGVIVEGDRLERNLMMPRKRVTG